MRGENIHGAPYDFRRAANEHSLYFARLKTLIETTYKQVRGWDCWWGVETEYSHHVTERGHGGGAGHPQHGQHHDPLLPPPADTGDRDDDFGSVSFIKATHQLGSLRASVPISCLLMYCV